MRRGGHDVLVCIWCEDWPVTLQIARIRGVCICNIGYQSTVLLMFCLSQLTLSYQGNSLQSWLTIYFSTPHPTSNELNPTKSHSSCTLVA